MKSFLCFSMILKYFLIEMPKILNITKKSSHLHTDKRKIIQSSHRALRQNSNNSCSARREYGRLAPYLNNLQMVCVLKFQL